MKNRVYIFTECGEKCGYGHLTRCIALYDEISRRGIEVSFIINSDTYEKTKSFLKGKTYLIKEWYKKPLELLKIENIDVRNYAIIDSYIASKATYKAIADSVDCALYIDDTGRLDYPHGIVINPSLFGEKLRYNRKKGQEYLLGHQYIILRKEFKNLYKEHNILKASNEVVSKILIIMGGSDVGGLTEEIVDNLKNSTYGTSEIVIIKGMSADEVCKHMMTADIAISAAGQTVHELIACRLPFVCIKLAENQNYNIEGLLEAKIISDYIDCNSGNLSSKLMDLLEQLMLLKNRKNIKARMSEIDLGKGAENIVNYMIEYDEKRC